MTGPVHSTKGNIIHTHTTAHTMKNASILITLLIATITTAGAQVNIADTLVTVTMTGPVPSTNICHPDGARPLYEKNPPTTKHFGFRTPARARTWATIAGFTSITVGAYLGGKAEMKSRYFGTSSNWDAFHITRDAGLICTGMGAAGLGASITIGEERPRWLPILWRLAAGAVLYRITAEATYNLTKPR